MKRLLLSFVACLMISTVARAQAPAAAEAPSATPAEAPAAPAPMPEPGAPASEPEAPASATPPAEGATAPVSEAPPEAPPAAAPSDKAAELPTVAVLALEANKAAEEDAAGIAALIASRLAESPRLKVLTQRDIEAMLSAERQRQLLGSGSCSQGTCIEQLSIITGARYMVTGRLDRFGDKYLLTVSLLDSVRGRSLARPRAEAETPDTLLQVATAVGEQLLAELVPSGKSTPAQPLLGSVKESPGGGFVLGLRINNSFIDNLVTLNPGADLEVGYTFHPEWVGFLQVGISFLRSDEEGQAGRLRVLPSVIGARHYYRLQHSLHPYWGLGLGVQLAFGQFGPFQSTGALPTVIGFGGLEYRIAGKVGLNLEVGTNLAQATLGLAENGLGDGLNLDVNAGISYHF